MKNSRFYQSRRSKGSIQIHDDQRQSTPNKSKSFSNKKQKPQSSVSKRHKSTTSTEFSPKKHTQLQNNHPNREATRVNISPLKTPPQQQFRQQVSHKEHTSSTIKIPNSKQSLISSISKRILYDSQNKRYPNIIQKKFRDGSYYIGQYNPVLNVKQGKGLYYYFEGDIYGGHWQNDQLNGLGLYFFANGDKYQGEVQNGRKHGFGQYEYTNGNRYKGFWSQDKKNGNGQYNFQNGDSYFGDYVNGLRQGKGIYKERYSGTCYEGQFHNNLKHGSGVLTIKGKQQIISGQWKQDVLDESHVKINFKDGQSLYEGQLINGQIEGNGVMKFADGLTYTGSFKKNKLCGQMCKIQYPNQDIYEGEVMNNRPHGQGAYYFNLKKYWYRGFWNNGKQQGKGQILLQNGTILQNLWKEGQIFTPNFKVIYCQNTGQFYEGQIDKEGRRQGQGKYFFPNPSRAHNFDPNVVSGVLISGHFTNNALVKMDSSVSHTIYRNKNFDQTVERR